MDKQPIEIFSGKWLDTYIGVYFSNSRYREDKSLGEFLASSIRELAPDEMSDYLGRRDL